jgi:eukaryotic-like serine/threonine-protein kinase
VPSVVGLDVASVEQALVAAGLSHSTTPYETCGAPEGVVIVQDYEAGTLVKPNTTVTITVAQAPPEGCDGGGGG